jgi:hypothetical protein
MGGSRGDPRAAGHGADEHGMAGAVGLSVADSGGGNSVGTGAMAAVVSAVAATVAVSLATVADSEGSRLRHRARAPTWSWRAHSTHHWTLWSVTPKYITESPSLSDRTRQGD